VKCVFEVRDLSYSGGNEHSYLLGSYAVPTGKK